MLDRLLFDIKLYKYTVEDFYGKSLFMLVLGIKHASMHAEAVGNEMYIASPGLLVVREPILMKMSLIS